MFIDIDESNNNIEIGDLLYSHKHETHCIIYKMISAGTQMYYTLIDITNSMSEIGRANSINAMIESNDLELICKKQNLMLSNID